MRYYLTFQSGRTWTAPIQALDPMSAIVRAGYELEALVAAEMLPTASCGVRRGECELGLWLYDRSAEPAMTWVAATPLETAPPAKASQTALLDTSSPNGPGLRHGRVEPHG